MTPAQQRGTLDFLLASRSGEGFLNDLQHGAGDTHRITAPTLVIGSEHDGSIEAEGANAVAVDIPGKEVLIVPAESHLVWFSDQKEVIEAKLREFLAQPQESTG